MSTSSIEPDNRSADALEREVEQERERVSHTIDALQAKFSMGNLIDEVARALSEPGGQVGRHLGRAIRDNPLPVLLTGMGLAWLIASSSRGGEESGGYGRRHLRENDPRPGQARGSQLAERSVGEAAYAGAAAYAREAAYGAVAEQSALFAPAMMTGPEPAERVFIRLPQSLLAVGAGVRGEPPTASQLVAEITDGRVKHARTLDPVPGLATAEVTPEEQTRLAREGAQIFKDVQFQIFDESVPQNPNARWWEKASSVAPAFGAPCLTDVMQQIRADQAWPLTQGSGVTIAVVDSGVSSVLPELPHGTKRSPVDPGGIYAGQHWDDPVGHGSMCAAIAAGGGGGSAYRGVAPEAAVLSARSDLSATDVASIYTNLILAKRQGRISGPLVVSNSWGLYTCKGGGLMPSNHPFMDVILQAVADDIVVVFAAGNNHVSVCKGDAQASGPNTIWGPNSHDSVITVGTVNRNETNRDASTPHVDSSRGRGEWAQLRDKPDCVAPTYGVVVWGSERQYMPWWGTSGACPQVAGLAALVLSLKPNLRPGKVADIIRNSCRRLEGEPELCVGRGIIDCDAAVRAVVADV